MNSEIAELNSRLLKRLKKEGQASKKIEEYSGEVKKQANKPLEYYQKQEAFYRGLFWICVGLLLIFKVRKPL